LPSSRSLQVSGHRPPKLQHIRFKTIRNPKAPGGAEFLPELVHNRSGVGSTVLAVDLNKDRAMDIVTTTNRGTFIFWRKLAAKAGAKTGAAKK
jgi:hypothetical protein